MKKFIDILKTLWSQAVEAFKAAKAWIRTDGLLHILVSIVLMMICGIWLNWNTSAGIVLLIGGFKELYDLVSGKGTPEWHDIFCDLIGIVIGAILLAFYAI